MNAGVILPPGWTWTTLGKISDQVNAVNPKAEPTKQFTYLDIASIDNSIQRVSEPKVYYGNEAPSRARQLVKANDVLFSTVRTYLKNIALVDQRYDGQIASTGFCVIRASGIVNPKFLFHFVQTNGFLNLLSRMQRGTSYPAVRDSDVMSQDFPLPPLPEQHRIVEKIEALFSELDKGVEQLKTAAQQLKVYRQAVLKAAFEGKLTEEWRKSVGTYNYTSLQNDAARTAAEPTNEYSVGTYNCTSLQNANELLSLIKQEREALAQATGKRLKPIAPLTEKELAELPQLPEGWAWVRFGSLVENFDGKRVPLSAKYRETFKGEFPYFGACDVIDYVREFLFDGEYLLIGEDGANLLSRSRPLAFVVKGRFWVNNHAHVCQPHRSIDIKFLESQFNSLTLNNYVTGTAQPKLTQANLDKIPVAVCSSAEQHQIIQEIETRLSVCDKLEETITASLQQAEALRQSILKKAFEGKLVPQDPNDPPASELLQKIKKEKEGLRRADEPAEKLLKRINAKRQNHLVKARRADMIIDRTRKRKPQTPKE